MNVPAADEEVEGDGIGDVMVGGRLFFGEGGSRGEAVAWMRGGLSSSPGCCCCCCQIGFDGCRAARDGNGEGV